MEITKLQIKMLSCCFFAGGLMLVGCSTDDSIDVGEIDTTIGVKLDNFSVPLGKTEDIALGDVLDLKEDDCIRTTSDGDYEFYQDGGDVTGAEPYVDPVKFANPKSETFAFSFTPSSMSSARSLNSLQGIVPDINVPAMTINAFSFSNDEPIKEVVSLTHAKASSDIKLDLDFGTVATLAKHVTLGLEFPEFLELALDKSSVPSGLNVTFENNKLTLNNIDTSKKIEGLKMKLNGITDIKDTKPTTGGDYAVVSSKEIAMSGEVKMNMFIASDDITVTPAALTTKYAMTAKVNFANNITLTEATGYFDPSIDIDDLGNINIGDDVPDFLKDNSVNIILSNPCITLGVTNTIDVKGIIDGQMIATYDDNSKKTLDINNIIVKPHPTGSSQAYTASNVIICRDQSKCTNVPEGAQFIELNGQNGTGDISELLNRIPKSITFTCSARTDKAYKGTITLGKKYKIKPSYSFGAPLSLEPGSTIAYNDSIVDFYKDIKDNDIDFNGDTKLTITGKVNNKTPLELELVPTPIDKDGKELKDLTLTTTNKIKSNLVESEPSNLEIILTKKAGVDLKSIKFDGIKFKVKASSAKAENLNKTKHTLKIEGLKIAIKSDLSINPDKKDKD